MMWAETSEPPRVRPVDASHIRDFIQLGLETNLSPWSAQSYLEEIKNPDAVLLRLAQADNTTLGFVVGRFVGNANTGRDAEIYNIAIRPAMQRHGMGQQLFDAFLAICRENGAKNIWLEVRQSNGAAIRFYEKNGFEAVQSRNSFYENPREHGLLMRLAVIKETA